MRLEQRVNFAASLVDAVVGALEDRGDQARGIAVEPAAKALPAADVVRQGPGEVGLNLAAVHQQGASRVVGANFIRFVGLQRVEGDALGLAHKVLQRLREAEDVGPLDCNAIRRVLGFSDQG